MDDDQEWMDGFTEGKIWIKPSEWLIQWRKIPKPGSIKNQIEKIIDKVLIDNQENTFLK